MCFPLRFERQISQKKNTLGCFPNKIKWEKRKREREGTKKKESKEESFLIFSVNIEYSHEIILSRLLWHWMYVVKLRKRLVVVWLFTLALVFQKQTNAPRRAQAKIKPSARANESWWKKNQFSTFSFKLLSLLYFAPYFFFSLVTCLYFIHSLSPFLSLSLLLSLSIRTQPICFNISYIDFFITSCVCVCISAYVIIYLVPFFSCHFSILLPFLMHYIHKLVGVETFSSFFLLLLSFIVVVAAVVRAHKRNHSQHKSWSWLHENNSQY